MSEASELKVEWVCTENNLADFFCKTLAHARFCMLRDKLLGDESAQSHFCKIIQVYIITTESTICRTMSVFDSSCLHPDD